MIFRIVIVADSVDGENCRYVEIKIGETCVLGGAAREVDYVDDRSWHYWVGVVVGFGSGFFLGVR